VSAAYQVPAGNSIDGSDSLLQIAKNF